MQFRINKNSLKIITIKRNKLCDIVTDLHISLRITLQRVRIAKKLNNLFKDNSSKYQQHL